MESCTLVVYGGRDFIGMAVSAHLGVIAVTDAKLTNIHLFKLPLAFPAGRRISLAPHGYSIHSSRFMNLRYTTFSGDNELLVADAGRGTVHVVDISRRACIGAIDDDGTMVHAHDVACQGRLVAVSCGLPGEYGVFLYEKQVSYMFLRKIGWTNFHPRGLAFSEDGTQLAVAECTKMEVVVFAVLSGAVVTRLSCVRNMDVEFCDGGWLTNSAHYMVCGTRTMNVDGYRGTDVLCAVQSLGLVFSFDNMENQIWVAATPFIKALACMSAPRVAWMTAVFFATIACRMPILAPSSSPSPFVCKIPRI